MREHIHTHTTYLRLPDGTELEVRIYGERRSDGTWAGWLEFHPKRGTGAMLRTDQETSQPNRAALEY